MGIQFSAIDETRTEPGFRGELYPVMIDFSDVTGGEGLPVIDWNMGNASAMFQLLGLPTDEQWGQLPLPVLRRAVMRAKARFERTAPSLTRAPSVQHGAPRENADGSIELRPVRVWGGGLDVEGMKTRLNAFSDFIELAAERGATAISWS